ncbi:uncharacterized protein LOC143916617 [Arctopsyche grandis]|uniref:uncharacterized protein LOC143916617 n=1 Tax=Arctopsyche grandis TaxID=121162 RepID=UPI00406D9E74
MESEASQQFCLRWHNHQSSVLGGLPALLDSGRLTDVTLCAGGRSMRAHRIVLSTCSPYFMDIFKDLPATQQPVVVILGGGWAELCCLVAFMYAGEVTLPRNLLPGLLRLARALRITGLTDLNGNIPDVPLQPEFDDSFNTKFESTFSTTFEEMKLSRQNSDSASCAESVSPFHKSFEGHKRCDMLGTPNDHNVPGAMMHENAYQELQLLKQLSKTYSDNEKSVHLKEELLGDGDTTFTAASGMLTRAKKSTKINKSSKYMTPVLNEIEPKNRKIDKIVENLKCNQLRTQDMNFSPTLDVSHTIDNQSDYFNINPKLNMSEKLMHPNKIQTTEMASPSCSSKVADIFASNNIFMETEPEREPSPETSAAAAIKSEPDSSPEILPDLKYVPLSPGTHAATTNTAKLYATCYVCHKRLSNQYNLRVHLETHQNARHACVACNHVSRSRDALRKHVSYRHPQLNASHGVGRPCKSNQNNQITTSPSIINPLSVQNLLTSPSSVFNFSNLGNVGETLSKNSKGSGNSTYSSSLDQTTSSQGNGSSNKNDDAKKSNVDQNF